MLTVEVVFKPDGTLSDEIEVYFDKEGLDYLFARMSHIRDGKTDHLNLMSESWGLGDLNETPHRETNRIAHHLRMTLTD